MPTFKTSESTTIELPKICMEPLTITIPANSKEHIIKVPCYVGMVGNTVLSDRQEKLLRSIVELTEHSVEEVLTDALTYLHLSVRIMESDPDLFSGV